MSQSEEKKPEYSGSANIYFEGTDAPKFGQLLDEWLAEVEKIADIQIKSHHYNIHAKKG